MMFREFWKAALACAVVGICAGSSLALQGLYSDVCPVAILTDQCDRCCRLLTVSANSYNNCVDTSDCIAKSSGYL